MDKRLLDMEKNKNHEEYVSNEKMTRDKVIPYYVDLIIRADPFGKEVKRVNDLILKKWTLSGLQYIKENAWKKVAGMDRSGLWILSKGQKLRIIEERIIDS